jgi:hypothetical protein
MRHYDYSIGPDEMARQMIEKSIDHIEIVKERRARDEAARKLRKQKAR